MNYLTLHSVISVELITLIFDGGGKGQLRRFRLQDEGKTHAGITGVDASIVVDFGEISTRCRWQYLARTAIVIAWEKFASPLLASCFASVCASSTDTLMRCTRLYRQCNQSGSILAMGFALRADDTLRHYALASGLILT